jgi:hypothetical protein
MYDGRSDGHMSALRANAMAGTGAMPCLIMPIPAFTPRLALSPGPKVDVQLHPVVCGHVMIIRKYLKGINS